MKVVVFSFLTLVLVGYSYQFVPLDPLKNLVSGFTGGLLGGIKKSEIKSSRSGHSSSSSSPSSASKPNCHKVPSIKCRDVEESGEEEVTTEVCEQVEQEVCQEVQETVYQEQTV